VLGLIQTALADTWGITGGELDTPTARWLYRTMRAAELAGADPGEAVLHAVQSRDMDGARDMPAVIDARMRPWVNAMAPQPAGQWADRVPQAADPEMREYLGQLATLMDERRERIGAHAAEHQPAWAVKALGPVPEDPGGAGPVAGAGQRGRRVPGAVRLRRRPAADRARADRRPPGRALWHEAWRALGPAGETDLRDRADGSLWLIRDQYQAESAWAPKHVGRELGYVRASAEDTRLRVIRSQAEAEAARKIGDAELAGRHEQQAERGRAQESAYRMQESILGGLMDDRRAWEVATEPQRRLAVAADTELRCRYPEMRIEPLRSAEPEQVTDEQRAELDALPEEQREYQPPAWMREAAEARKAFSEKLAERHSVMEPHEDPDYADVGPAFPPWQQQDRDAVLQPPKPPIPPSERLAEREAEAGEHEP
jgi:hypothetical protein